MIILGAHSAEDVRKVVLNYSHTWVYLAEYSKKVLENGILKNKWLGEDRTNYHENLDINVLTHKDLNFIPLPVLVQWKMLENKHYSSIPILYVCEPSESLNSKNFQMSFIVSSPCVLQVQGHYFLPKFSLKKLNQLVRTGIKFHCVIYLWEISTLNVSTITNGTTARFGLLWSTHQGLSKPVL